MAPITARSYRTRRPACDASAASTASFPAAARAAASSGAGSRVQAQRGERLVERAPAEQRRGRGPERSVAVAPLRPQLAAERDELRQVGDRVDLVCGGDADEAVRVEVVAEEQRACRRRAARRGASARSGRDSPRRSSRARARSSGSPSGEKTGRTRRAPRTRQSAHRLLSSAAPRGDLVPEVSHRRLATAATVRSISSSPCAVEGKIASNCDGGK